MYSSRVSVFFVFHFFSVSRMRRFTSCQIRKSIGFRSGLRFGISRGLIFSSTLAAFAIFDL